MKQFIIPQKSPENSKKPKKLLESKGFYMIVAVCLILIGIYGYTATQKNQINNQMAYSDLEPKTVTPEVVPPSVSEASTQSDTSVEKPKTPEVDETSTEAELKFAKPVDAQISIPYSKDNLIYSKTMEDWRTHLGIDISGNIGTPVKAAANGVVEQVKTDEMLGTVVIIRHNDQLKTKYCNLQSEALVKEGQAVDVGAVIGGIGNTAESEIADGPHLHFEVLSNGELVNPEDYIPVSE